jgi:hypothetical protein
MAHISQTAPGPITRWKGWIYEETRRRLEICLVYFYSIGQRLTEAQIKRNLSSRELVGLLRAGRVVPTGRRPHSSPTADQKTAMGSN